MTSHLRSFAGGLAVTALVFLCPYTRGQEANLRQFDPSYVYFQAWLKIREGEEAEKEEKFLDAFNHYKKAASLFDTVGVYHPEWKPHLVKDRQATTRTSMDKIRDKALQAQRAQENKLDGIVLEGPGTAGKKPELGIKPLSPNEQRHLADLQRQIRSLQLQLKNAANDRDANAAQLKRTLSQLETQRAQMARSPLKGQVAQLTTQIAELQKEREVMAQALHKSREEHQNALTLLTTREADQKAAHKKIAKQENLLNVQKNAANEVVQGLRDQLKEMKTIAAEKDSLLAQANADKEQLSQKLRESHAEIADLKEERGELLKDRERMATLLQLNETDRVKVLIEQNMQLGR